MRSQNSIFNDDFLISGKISAILSPIVIIMISIIFNDFPPIGIFIVLWVGFAIIGTVIFFIISSFTKEGLSVLVRGRMGSDYETIEKDLEIILPLPAPPSETISKEKTQESHSDENVLESEKVPEIEESSMEKLEKLIERRNAGEMTSEDFEEAKKKILERKPQYNKELGDVQEEVHSDDMIEEEIKDSIVSKSNVASGGKSKSEELREAKALLDDGIINEDDYEKMKREIIG